ncbi:MAG: RsmB/NOP family class I SAM-dependent RNA methyltransferase [Candidatus Bathyarchaeota archaeon]|nr:RsmB/NOP family class I SAM-dependent RNA methyltransferase [Candidatus Bathyarchaeota archaeon]
MALAKTVKQLSIRNPDAIRLGYGLVLETERRRNLIDKYLNHTLGSKKLEEFTVGIQAFLRLYVYQTRVTRDWEGFDLKEAEHIARLGRAILGWETLREVEPYLGFLLTQKIEPILEAAKDEEKVALQTYHPAWFVKYCFDLFGKEEAVAFLEGNLTPPETCIRLSTLRSSQEEILQKLDAEGVTLEKVEPLKHTYRVIRSKNSLNRIDSYRLGFFYIQDKASCFAAEAADPKPDDTVLDLCAAPGAKTTYLAQLMQNRGVVYSVDYSKRRMKTWRQEVGRMWVNIADPVIADARSPLPLQVEADVVILDPPCTSTGVFAKLPAAKWRLSPKSIEKMTDIQWMMINNCVDKVKTGGFLTYSTCSVTVEENEMIVERFLQRHPEFQLVDVAPRMGLPGLRGLEKCQRLYPHVHRSNGFFIAKLQKIA